MKYRIIYERDVIEKDFTKLDNSNRRRIIKEVGEKLSNAPDQFGRPLGGQLKNCRRLRVGDYRVIYRIDREKTLVLVAMVIHRRSKYKNVARRLSEIRLSDSSGNQDLGE